MCDIAAINPDNQAEITPEVARALREDLSCLEAERNYLKSMQVSI